MKDKLLFTTLPHPVAVTTLAAFGQNNGGAPRSRTGVFLVRRANNELQKKPTSNRIPLMLCAKNLDYFPILR